MANSHGRPFPPGLPVRRHVNRLNTEVSREVNTQKTKVETVEGTREQKSAAGQLQPLTIVELTGKGARQQALEPNERESSMFSTTSGGGSSSTVSLCHHDYEARHLQQPLHIGVGVQSPQTDHSLHADINLMAPSPNSLTMYEHDQSGLHGSLSSCGSDDPLSPSLDFDLKPQFECNDDSLFKLDLACLNSSFGNVPDAEQAMFKMEDVFQEEKGHDVGPTLAALNFENSVTMPGFLENDVESGFMNGAPSLLVQPYTTGQPEQQNIQQPLPDPKQWNPTSLITAFLARPSLRSFNSQSNPTKPTCTVSSPTNANSQMIKNEKNDANAFEVTGHFSLVPDTPATSGPTERNVSKTSTSMIENKSALADLLTQTLTPMGVGGAAAPVQVKTEEMFDHPQACQHNTRTLTELTPMKKRTKRSISPDDNSSNSVASVDRKWEEIKQFIHDDETPTFPTSAEPLIKKIKTEPEDIAYNPADDSDSEDEFDSDLDPNALSDTESIGSSFTDDYAVSSSKREKRYFWQYNTQSKGPKGKRLCKSVASNDPHILTTFEDPVFDPELNQSQYKHNGKARKGDGNDVTPNPNKLYSIGKELKKLNRIINEITPPSELPSGVRPKTRKEKNKLASRACRLKKKAQHEANKVKLYGLEREHQKLVQVLEKMKWEAAMRIQDPSSNLKGEKVAVKLDKLIKRYLTQMIAGNTTDYVNSVLSKVAGGDKSGGLDR